MAAPKITVSRRNESATGVTLVLEEKIGNDRNLDSDRREIAYVLRYLPDTNEVALIRDDEILYSEEVS